MAATQPSGRRGHAGGSEASMSMMSDAGEREDDLGEDAVDVGDWRSPLGLRD